MHPQRYDNALRTARLQTARLRNWKGAEAIEDRDVVLPPAVRPPLVLSMEMNRAKWREEPPGERGPVRARRALDVVAVGLGACGQRKDGERDAGPRAHHDVEVVGAQKSRAQTAARAVPIGSRVPANGAKCTSRPIRFI